MISYVIAKNNENAYELRLKYYQNTIEPLHVWTTVHAFFKMADAES